MDRSSGHLKNLHVSSNTMIYLGLILVVIGAASYILNSLQLWPFSSEETFEPSDSSDLSSDSSVPTINPAGIILKDNSTIDVTEIVTGLLPSPQPLLQPTETPGMVPERLVIPSIKLDVPIERVINGKPRVESEKFDSWKAPNKYAGGWHESSALLGKPGNTVINGHNSYSLNGVVIL